MCGYGWSSDTSVAPPIDGNVAVIFTTFRESFATQTVLLPGSPVALDTSIFHAVNVPAGTVTCSTPTPSAAACRPSASAR
jgi:hypothetical protein